MKNIANIHPGEILGKEFLEPLEISAYKLSKSIGVQQNEPNTKKRIIEYLNLFTYL